MNQALLRMMAEERLLDASALLAANRWAYAYYVAGYAVECGLKSCVLSRMIHTGGGKDKKFSEQCFTHDFGRLIELAGLDSALAAENSSNAVFPGFWGTATLWKETSRYEPKTQADAESLVAAIMDQPNGVMRWIRNYW